MTATDILSAFLTRLEAFSASPEIPVAWPNRNFEPPDSGFWFEASWFPNEPADYGWDTDSCHNDRGFCQVLVCYRHDSGQVNASEIADAVIAHFPKGLDLGPVRVLKRPWQSPAVTLDKHSYIPVTIRYQGLT